MKKPRRALHISRVDREESTRGLAAGEEPRWPFAPVTGWDEGTERPPNGRGPEAARRVSGEDLTQRDSHLVSEVPPHYLPH